MFPLVSTIVEGFELVLVLLAQTLGGHLGAGVLSFAFLSRLALLPITYRIARKARAHRRALQGLQPKLKLIREKYSSDPVEQAKAMSQVHQAAGVPMIEPSVLRGALLQTPIMFALFSAVRNVVGRIPGGLLGSKSLMAPSFGLAILAGVAVGLSALAGADSQTTTKAWSWIVPAVFTLGVLAFMPSFMGVYTIGASMVGGAQGILLRIQDRKTE